MMTMFVHSEMKGFGPLGKTQKYLSFVQYPLLETVRQWWWYEAQGTVAKCHLTSHFVCWTSMIYAVRPDRLRLCTEIACAEVLEELINRLRERRARIVPQVISAWRLKAEVL